MPLDPKHLKILKANHFEEQPMVTEFKVLTDFEEGAKALPELNRRKVQK